MKVMTYLKAHNQAEDLRQQAYDLEAPWVQKAIVVAEGIDRIKKRRVSRYYLDECQDSGVYLEYRDLGETDNLLVPVRYLEADDWETLYLEDTEAARLTKEAKDRVAEEKRKQATEAWERETYARLKPKFEKEA